MSERPLSWFWLEPSFDVFDGGVVDPHLDILFNELLLTMRIGGMAKRALKP